MPYIGQSPTQVAFVTDSFSGNGSTTAFTMSVAPANTASVLVVVSGVVQDPSTYSVSGTTLTFTGAPPSGTANISTRYLGIPASGVTTTAYRTITEFTATASQTTFTPPSYTVGFIQVFRNGVLLGSADYTATNGTTVVLTTGATSGDLVTTISFYVSSVLNAIPAIAGAVNSTYLAANLTLVTPNLGTPSAINLTNATSLPSSALPVGSVLQVVYANTSNQFTTASSTGVDITGLTASITPRSSSNKILVLTSLNAVFVNGVSSAFAYGLLNKNGSNIGQFGYIIGYMDNTNNRSGAASYQYLDSPATTSAVTYKIQGAVANGGTVNYQRDSQGISSLTLMEIAG